MCNVVLTDLHKGGVAVPARIAVVSRPVRVGGHFAKAVPGTAQQEHAAVSGPHLQVVKTLAEDVAVDGLAVCPVASGAAGLASLAPDIDGFDVLCGEPRNYHKEPHQHGSHIRSNCLM